MWANFGSARDFATLPPVHQGWPKLNLDGTGIPMHSGAMRKVPVTIHIDADLKARLNAETKRRRCSISQVLRELILENLKPTAVKERRKLST